MAVRAEGASGAREAFVLLNRCLDLAEAADDDSAHLLDFTDFGTTTCVNFRLFYRVHIEMLSLPVSNHSVNRDILVFRVLIS